MSTCLAQFGNCSSGHVVGLPRRGIWPDATPALLSAMASMAIGCPARSQSTRPARETSAKACVMRTLILSVNTRPRP